MEDEKVTEQNVQSQEPAVREETQSAPAVNTDDIVNGITEKLFKKLEEQNTIIESLKKTQLEAEKKVTELNAQLSKIDDKVQDSLPQVVGDFDFDEVYGNLNRDELDKMEQENRKIYDTIKKMYKR